jgi:hypothetical protein
MRRASLGAHRIVDIQTSLMRYIMVEAAVAVAVAAVVAS